MHACACVHVGMPELTCGSQETCGSAEAGSLLSLSLSLTPGSRPIMLSFTRVLEKGCKACTASAFYHGPSLLGNLLQPMAFERLDQVGRGLGYQIGAWACSLTSLAWMLDLVPVHICAEDCDL